jgi:hypothetical protein
MTDRYAPRPEHKFSFGLWTVGNRGRDPFGDVVRDALPPVDAVALLAEVGAWGVNLHDNDLVPIDATPSERDRIVDGFKTACRDHDGVRDFARGCMRTYLILKEKAQRFAQDAEIQAALAVAKAPELGEPTSPGGLGHDALDAIAHGSYDVDALAAQGYGNERLDQLVVELLLGVR